MAPDPPSPERFDADDATFMALALDEARAAYAEDEVPIGAVIVAPPEGEGPVDPVNPVNRVLARGHNRTRAACDPTAHAEILALRQATRVLGYPRLEGCTVYSTVEPCFMCAGALVHARVARVVWAVRDPKFGGAVSLGNVLTQSGSNHHAEIAEGLGAEEARELLQRFFRAKR